MTGRGNKPTPSFRTLGLSPELSSQEPSPEQNNTSILRDQDCDASRVPQPSIQERTRKACTRPDDLSQASLGLSIFDCKMESFIPETRLALLTHG